MIDDLLRWVPVRRYAAWHDRGLYHFLTVRAERRRYLDLLEAALTPGGVVVIGAFVESRRPTPRRSGSTPGQMRRRPDPTGPALPLLPHAGPGLVSTPDTS